MPFKQSQKFIGLTLPISNGQFGYFTPSTLTKDQIKSNLKNLILTNPGQRIMNPEFGTKITQLLFQNINQDIGKSIIQNVQTAIKT